MNPDDFQSVGQIIQLSVAPAFLLVAVGSFINVATLRLGRVMDRARALETVLGNPYTAKPEPHQIDELVILNNRMASINLAIMFATFAALLVCFVVALLFISDLMEFDAARFLALLFIATMVMLVTSLLFFLREILIARRSLHVHKQYLRND